MSRLSRMGALRIVDRAKWEAEVRRAMRGVDTLDEAAEKLDVGKRQLQRWLDEDLPDVEKPPPGRRWPAKK